MTNLPTRYSHNVRQLQSLTDPLPIPTVSGILNTGETATIESIDSQKTLTGLLLNVTAAPEPSGAALPLVPGQSAVTITTNISSISSTQSANPTSSSANHSSHSTESNTLPIGAIVGICVGVFLGLSCLLLFLLLSIRKNRKVRMQGLFNEINSVGAGAGRGAGASVEFSPSFDDMVKKNEYKQYPLSSLSSYSNYATKSPSASSKMRVGTSNLPNYTGNLGLAHTFHDRTSLYTDYSSNGDTESYNDIIINMNVSSRTRFSPPIDGEETEVETSPITPNHSMLAGTVTRAISTGVGVNERGRETYFSTKSNNPWSSSSSSSVYSNTPRAPAITLTTPASITGTGTTSSPSNINIDDSMAEMQHSYKTMESLLEALNIPLSPVDNTGEGEREWERLEMTMLTSSMARISNSTLSTIGDSPVPEIFPLPPTHRAS